MKGKKRSLLVQLNNHIHITGLFLATRTKFSKTLTLPTYTGVRVESVETKHMHGSCYPNYTTLSDLVVKYENISFVRFVDYVIGEATKHHCFDRSSACQVNEHYRQVFALKMCVFV